MENSSLWHSFHRRLKAVSNYSSEAINFFNIPCLSYVYIIKVIDFFLWYAIEEHFTIQIDVLLYSS